MQLLENNEKTVSLFNEWCSSDENIHEAIKRLTKKGILKYGFQLVKKFLLTSIDYS